MVLIYPLFNYISYDHTNWREFSCDLCCRLVSLGQTSSCIEEHVVVITIFIVRYCTASSTPTFEIKIRDVVAMFPVSGSGIYSSHILQADPAGVLYGFEFG